MDAPRQRPHSRKGRGVRQQEEKEDEDKDKKGEEPMEEESLSMKRKATGQSLVQSPSKKRTKKSELPEKDQMESTPAEGTSGVSATTMDPAKLWTVEDVGLQFQALVC